MVGVGVRVVFDLRLMVPGNVATLGQGRVKTLGSVGGRCHREAMDTSKISRGSVAATAPDACNGHDAGHAGIPAVCTIIPPYLLQAMGRSTDAGVRAIAERTLRHDGILRADRRSEPASTSTLAAAGDAVIARCICDAHHGTTLPGAQVRAEGAPASGDVAVNEAYDALGDTWRLYHDVYGRNSVDGRGLELVGSVHYSTNYDNAFWNGEQMVFGDGDGVMFTRFTASVDVIGHELTHGVTQYTAALAYRDQPGALNESMSDVFGSLVKQYALGQDAASADWLIGAGILGPTIRGRALRDMLHPGTAYDDPHLGKDPQPADMAHYVHTSDDDGGVHLNSGIPNRAFALAATSVGGRAWEGVGRVWYDVLTGGRISADCDFATFAGLTVDAASARFGATHAVTTAVRQAWTTVGVLDGTTASNTSASGPAQEAGSGQGSASDEVQVRRSGGIAGITRQTSVRLDQLPAADAEHWRSLLSTGLLPALQAGSVSSQGAGSNGDGSQDDGPAGAGVRDGYTYAVECVGRGVRAAVGEQSLPEAVRHLFERTLDAG